MILLILRRGCQICQILADVNFWKTRFYYQKTSFRVFWKGSISWQTICCWHVIVSWHDFASDNKNLNSIITGNIRIFIQRHLQFVLKSANCIEQYWCIVSICQSCQLCVKPLFSFHFTGCDILRKEFFHALNCVLHFILDIRVLLSLGDERS